MSIRILLVEDHRMVRQTLRRFLESEKDFQLVGEAGDGIQALDLVGKHRPDVLLLDLMLPGLNGLEVIRRVHLRYPRTRILVLSMHEDQGYVLKALKNGALGYLVKNADVADLVAGVRAVAAGRQYLSPPLSDWAIANYTRKQSATDSFDLYDTLTNREKEVLQLVAEGHTNAVVAARLGISGRTVETHRSHIMGKLGLNCPAELVRFAIEHGILPLQRPPTPGAEAGPAGEPADPGAP